MEVAAFLRLIWRRRISVTVGAVVAVAVAVTLGRSPGTPSAVAQTRVVVDTPQSQLVTGAPRGAETLYWRATLLAMLLGAEHARQQIAREIGVDPHTIAILDSELATPANPTSLPVAATQAAAATTERYILDVQTDDVLPIVSIATTAPDRAGAVRLAAAAVHALQTSASARNSQTIQGLRIEQVSPIRNREIAGGAGLKKMVAIAAVVFALWCVFTARGPSVARRMRTIAQARPVGS